MKCKMQNNNQDIGYTEISIDLMENPIIENLKDDHYKAFCYFLRLLNQEDKIRKINGITVKVKKGEILTTYKDLAKNLGVHESSLYRFFDKLRKNGIVNHRSVNNGNTHNFSKSIFSLNEKYINRENA